MKSYVKFSDGRMSFDTLVVSLIGPLILLEALSAAQAPPAPHINETAQQKYRNIKVFKDLPAARLIHVMRAWNVALGVRCEYCHVILPNHTGFERDDKPEKNTARQMVLMVQRMNSHEKAVKGKVNCIMCHRGHHNLEGPDAEDPDDRGSKPDEDKKDEDKKVP